MNFFVWGKNNVLFLRCIDFCVFVKSTDFKICDVTSRHCYKTEVISQEHCTDRGAGFPMRKLTLIPLITFFGNFATFFGNNFLLLQRFLANQETWRGNFAFPPAGNKEIKYQDGGLTEFFLRKTGDILIKNLNILPLPV